MQDREIKFRVWDIKSKCFLNGDNHAHAITNRGRLLVGETEWFQSLRIADEEKYIIQQFTGLSDKNKKDIFEGDIIKIPLYPNYIVKFGQFNMNGNLSVIGFYLYDGRRLSNPLGFLIERTGIIGNICENSELLKNG